MALKPAPPLGGGGGAIRMIVLDSDLRYHHGLLLSTITRGVYIYIYTPHLIVVLIVTQALSMIVV